ncbi:MAG: hypothetical protein QME28_07140 [Candidatus Saccharicenans sp.]|nr:hypothetical protein [Candidatus Saccharicenans sp.]
MRKILSLLIILTLAAGLYSILAAQQKAVRSQPVAEPRQIDGDEGDWEGTPFLSFSKAGVDYAVAHDSDYLYLILIFRNREGLSTGEQTGVAVYISQPGKKNKDYGYHFVRKVVSAEEAITRMEAYGQMLTEEAKAQIRAKKVFAFYEGEPAGKKFQADLKKIEGQKFEPAIFRNRVLQQRATGPEARGGAFQKAVFEFRIPLRPSPALPPLIEPGKPISLGLEWGGMTEKMKQDLMARRAAEASRASAQDTRMVVSGEDPEAGGFDRGAGELSFRQVPKKFSFWFDLLLTEED